VPGEKRPALPPEPPPTRAEVWLTGPAVADLHRLDGAPLVWSLKKMLLLEAHPLAGEPLLGSLIGYRKLVVGDRDCRIVWRATTDQRGQLTIEIAEVWAVGAGAGSKVYSEMTERVASLGDTPVRRSLADTWMSWRGPRRVSRPSPGSSRLRVLSDD